MTVIYHHMGSHDNYMTCPPSPQTGECLRTVKEHRSTVTDLQASKDMTMVVTASKDNTAKVLLSVLSCHNLLHGHE